MVYIWKCSQFVITKQLSGAAEARRAHNPEGNGSKPFSANIFVFGLVCQVIFFLLLADESLLQTHRSQKALCTLDLMMFRVKDDLQKSAVQSAVQSTAFM